MTTSEVVIVRPQNLETWDVFWFLQSNQDHLAPIRQFISDFLDLEGCNHDGNVSLEQFRYSPENPAEDLFDDWAMGAYDNEPHSSMVNPWRGLIGNMVRGIWRAKQAFLQFDLPDDIDGLIEDLHWGSKASFPGDLREYTIGYESIIFEAIRSFALENPEVETIPTADAILLVIEAISSIVDANKRSGTDDFVLLLLDMIFDVLKAEPAAT